VELVAVELDVARVLRDGLEVEAAAEVDGRDDVLDLR
jgi:hypothetical protein